MAAPLALDVVLSSHGLRDGNVDDDALVGGTGLVNRIVTVWAMGKMDILFLINVGGFFSGLTTMSLLATSLVDRSVVAYLG